MPAYIKLFVQMTHFTNAQRRKARKRITVTQPVCTPVVKNTKKKVQTCAAIIRVTYAATKFTALK